jgi:hypothetical protein
MLTICGQSHDPTTKTMKSAIDPHSPHLSSLPSSSLPWLHPTSTTFSTRSGLPWPLVRGKRPNATWPTQRNTSTPLLAQYQTTRKIFTRNRQIDVSGGQLPWYVVGFILQPPDVNLLMAGSASVSEWAGTVRRGILALIE